jgi:calcium-dependent protein kinase
MRGSKDIGKLAVKKISKRLVQQGSRERFLAEVELLKELDHPNICRLHEVFEDEHALYLVLDLCEGGELFDRIVEEELDGEQHVASLTRQIAQALRYCHEVHGIIHRDLKPENVLFVSWEREAAAKLIDFGIACHFRGGVSLDEEIGTAAYSAPEVILGEDYTEKCDLWSLGAVLYCMLSGGTPFQTIDDTLDGRFAMDDEQWGHVSDEAKDLVCKLLVLDPVKRLSATQVLEHPWLASCFQEKVKSIPGQIVNRLKRFKHTSNFRKILLTCFARHLATKDLPDICDAFNAIDRGGDGMLSFDEFHMAMSSVISTKVSTDESKVLFDAIDIDGSGLIDYSEFLAAAIDRKLLFREDICLQVFRMLDRGSKGRISFSDLQALVEETITEERAGKELRDEAWDMMRRYDSNGDGHLDLRELMALLTQNSLVDLKKRCHRYRHNRCRSNSIDVMSPETNTLHELDNGSECNPTAEDPIAQSWSPEQFSVRFRSQTFSAPISVSLASLFGGA